MLILVGFDFVLAKLWLCPSNITTKAKPELGQDIPEMTFYTETVVRITRERYPKDQPIRQVINAKQFIDSHFADPINLASIAQEAFYSKFHFIRCFKTLYGRTPYQYLISVRIEAAKQFLQTDASIADICYKIGFESVTSFTSLFKKMTGETPAVYRNRKKQFSRIETKNQFGDLPMNHKKTANEN